MTKWKAKAAQMINRSSEEGQLTMAVKNLLPVQYKYLFAQYFSSFKALLAVGTQIEDAVNNGTINEEAPRAKKNFGSSKSKIVEVSHIYKTDLYQLISLVQAFQDQLPNLEDNFMSYTCY